jgi:hypothetical protein
MTRFESSYKPSMCMVLLFATLLAGGGIGRAFAAVAPGITVAPGSLVGAATEPTVISSSPSNRATRIQAGVPHSPSFHYVRAIEQEQRTTCIEEYETAAVLLDLLELLPPRADLLAEVSSGALCRGHRILRLRVATTGRWGARSATLTLVSTRAGLF